MNKSKDSPFFRRVEFPTTRGIQKKIVPETFERALQYIEEMRLPKLEDTDLQRDFLVTIWTAVFNGRRPLMPNVS